MNRGRLAPWRWWIAVAAAVAGLLIGLLIALVSPHDRRAEAAVRVAGPAALLPDIRELATSSVLAGNVTTTLRLQDSPESVQRRLSASVRRGTQLVEIRATASTTDKARQLAQEAAVVLTQIAPTRFPAVDAVVFDPGHGIGGGDRHWLRDLGLGLLGGLCAGLLAAALLADGTAPVAARPRDARLEEREQLLARRTELVGRREAAVAKRVGELAARELEVEARAIEIDERRGAQPGRSTERVVPPPEPATRLPPAEQTQTTARTAHQVRAGDRGRWTIQELERLVAATADSDSGRAEELSAYVYFLRDYADADGSIPSTFDSLISEILGAASSPPG